LSIWLLLAVAVAEQTLVVAEVLAVIAPVFLDRLRVVVHQQNPFFLLQQGSHIR
jgi:hypothetical protein